MKGLKNDLIYNDNDQCCTNNGKPRVRICSSSRYRSCTLCRNRRTVQIRRNKMKSLPSWLKRDDVLIDDPEFMFVFEPFQKEEYDIKEHDISNAWLMEPFMDVQ